MPPRPPPAIPEPEVGLGLGRRRSLRLASRSYNSTGVGRDEAMGSEKPEADTKKKGKRSFGCEEPGCAIADDSSPGERGDVSQFDGGGGELDLNFPPGEFLSPEEEGRKRKRLVDAADAEVGLDLNCRPVEFSLEDEGEKIVDGAAAVDLNLPLDSNLEGFEGEECSRDDQMKTEVINVDSVSEGPQGEDSLNLASESRDDETRTEVINVDSDQGTVALSWGAHGRRRYSREEKGKQVIAVDSDSEVEKVKFWEFLPGVGDGGVRGDGGREEKRCDDEGKGKSVAVEDSNWLSLVAVCEELKKAEETKWRREVYWRNYVRDVRRSRNREVVERLAPEFAVFKSQEEDKGGEIISQTSKDDPPADCPGPGPFSTAMKVIDERIKELAVRQLDSSSAMSNSFEFSVQWVPLCDSEHRQVKRQVPSLRELCLRVLSENGPEIESLECIPDDLRHQLSFYLCRSRRMDCHVLSLLTRGSPTEIRLPDCSWATEQQAAQIFSESNFEQLAVLQLDLSGRCMPDYILSSSLCKSPDSMPVLTTISLRGAFRLTDDGLMALVSSAPQLSSINLGHCSLLTSGGIIHLVEKLESVLNEFNLEGCQNVDALMVLPALKKLKVLKVLSVAGLQTVNDIFVCELISVHGPNMKELVLRGCKELTTTSTKMIGEKCAQLCSLDLGDLCQLSDYALGHIADGCMSIKKLNLRRNAFSDKAVAAFLEASGNSLSELSLNNVKEVACWTALAISYRCSLNLRSLDLSFCRKMTNEALGLIADSCSYLRTVKLFGCRQITSVFLNGHSNAHMKIIGLEGSILEDLDMPMLL